jgi:hypothetical protein
MHRRSSTSAPKKSMGPIHASFPPRYVTLSINPHAGAGDNQTPAIRLSSAGRWLLICDHAFNKWRTA